MSAAGWVAVALGAACCLGVLPASAAISARIPEECGAQSEFEFELEQRLANLSAAETTRVTLTPEPSGYLLVVEAANQRRELHDSNCRELLRAAIVIAIALLDPTSKEAAPEPEPEPEPERPVPLVPPPPASNAPNRPHSRPKIAVAAGGGVHVGTLPRATPMLELDSQLKWKRFGIAAGLRYLLPQSTVDESEPGARISAVGAYLAGLFEPWRRIQVRVGIASYRLSAQALRSTEIGDGSAWELGLAAGTTFTPFERPPFFTLLGLEGQLNLIQPTFKILPDYEVFQVPLVSGSGFARAGVVF